MNNIYYVYLHIDPRTDTILYVGKGCYGRAWDVTRNRTGNPDHLEWCKELSKEGFVPEEWVTIKYQGLSEKEAFDKEKEWLHNNFCPKFNRQSGEKNYQAKLTNDQAREIYSRSNENHSKLAVEFNVSRSCISMIATRKQWRAATACMI